MDPDRTPKKKRAPRDWRKRFLKSLSDWGNVRAACHAAGITRPMAYLARDRDPKFAAAWEEALEDGVDLLEVEARRRALRGVEKPVFYQGAQVSAVREYSDVLMIFLLKAHRPEKYRDNFNLHAIAEQLATIRGAADAEPPPGDPPATGS